MHLHHVSALHFAPFKTLLDRLAFCHSDQMPVPTQLNCEYDYHVCKGSPLRTNRTNAHTNSGFMIRNMVQPQAEEACLACPANVSPFTKFFAAFSLPASKKAV
jgi:hypothetical protein